MKTFFRAMAATLACLLLLTFSLWRYEAIPDLSGISNFIKDTMDQLEKLTPVDIDSIWNSGEGQQSLRPVESNGEYDGYEPSEELPEDLVSAIRATYEVMDTSVDLSDFSLTSDELKAVVSEVRYSCPEYFYVANTYNYVSSTQTGYIEEFCPIYLCDAEELKIQTARYEQTIAEIAAGAPTSGSDFDKILYLHDYFVQNYTYDYTYTIRDAYTFFEQKTGVCQAYMLALIATADALGIRSIPVTSDVMNHAWNLVELEGSWYHVDVTWDDTGSYSSYTSYDYFLQSDYGINAYDMARDEDGVIDEDSKVHREWKSAERADNAQYDNAVWRGSRAPMVKMNNEYYCVVSAEKSTEGAIYGGSSPLSMQEMKSIEGIWRLGGTAQYYVGCYSGLAVWGDKLVYNTDNMIRVYDPATGQDRLFAMADVVYGESVFGILKVSTDGTVSYIVADKLNGDDYTVKSATSP